ncbi:winged helix-turn-helix transcriptional regulator [Aerophototrophica crusticola]|uniref:Winged helix-turn-helix transcriptional regulator n=1 Tax=Aerophototrophica crusticola TaxID=1709002 RepID=A0A858R428_9PROT|nr:winged helix-turn-helix transcriptional regulator [Rhodospirillaceae bacterium B3]
MTKQERAATEGIEGQATSGEVEAGLGQVLRDAHRAMSRALQSRIALHGVSMGQWFFLRALWEQDGLTQRELSQRVGMMEPTTVTAINSMERRGLVTRVRNPHDRRKVNIFLTPKGKDLRGVLLPCSAEVARAAVAGMPEDQMAQLMAILARIIGNLDSATDPATGLVSPEALED